MKANRQNPFRALFILAGALFSPATKAKVINKIESFDNYAELASEFEPSRNAGRYSKRSTPSQRQKRLARRRAYAAGNLYAFA